MPFWNHPSEIHKTVARFGTWAQIDKKASCDFCVSNGRTRVWLQHLNAGLVGSYFAASSAVHGRHQTHSITDWPWKDKQPSSQTLKIMRGINLQYVFPCCCFISFLVSPTAFDWVLLSGWRCLPHDAQSEFTSRPFVVLSGLGHFLSKFHACTALLCMRIYSDLLLLRNVIHWYTLPGKKKKSTVPSFPFY